MSVNLEQWKAQHTGLSHARCSQLAAQLIKEAHLSGVWDQLVDQLAFLREEIRLSRWAANWAHAEEDERQ